MQTQPPPIVDIEWTVVTPATEAPKAFVGWRVGPILFRPPWWLGEVSPEDAETLRWAVANFSKIMLGYFVLAAIFGVMARM